MLCPLLLLSALDSGPELRAPMEELLEADVLWPETPPLSRDRELYLPELHEDTAAAAAAEFSCESFGSDMSGPAASSSSSSASSSVPGIFGGGSSGGFLSHPPTFAGGHGHDDDASFQEADVLWPDNGYATRDRDVDGGELWWLCCGFGGDDAAAGSSAEPSVGGKRGPWRAPLVSSPIDIPTGVAAARRRRRAGATPIRMAHW
uniref:Uncharacterized protein n=1 Tax=Avena sativa TaxID=4498 RepID=A0ACD5U0Q1_AVESA